MGLRFVQTIAGLDWGRRLVGLLLGIALASAMAMWLGVCPTCENPQLLTIPYLRFAPVVGTGVAAVMLLAWAYSVRLSGSNEFERERRVWSALLSSLSLILLLGAIFVSTFAAVTFKPCALCAVFWLSLALAGIVGLLWRLSGSWTFYLAGAASVVAATLILFSPLRYSVHAVMSSYMGSMGLPEHALWPSSLRMTGIDTYVVVADCTPCNANSGQAVIDRLAKTRTGSLAVLVYEESIGSIRIPPGVATRSLTGDNLRVVSLPANSPPFVFEVEGLYVKSCTPASQFVTRLNEE